VLSTYLLKPPAHEGDHDTKVIAWMKARYTRMLGWALGNERKTVLIALGGLSSPSACSPSSARPLSLR
jgi:cobalt-zinc-cadmium resistance protein CzcA